jgi:hypothetical protein
MRVTASKPRIPLSVCGRKTGLTRQGLLKILLRTNGAIREDGHWYAEPETIHQIESARQVLGLNRTKCSAQAP